MSEPEQVVTPDEEAFGSWLAGLETDEAEEPEPIEEEDPVLIAKQTKRELDEMKMEKRTDDMMDEFVKKAPEEAVQLVSIWRKGDETPEQLKKLMELANVKAHETAVASEPEIEAKAEEKAAKLASEQYGVGPIAPGGAGPSEEDVWEAARQRVRKGDMHTAYQMFESLPPTGGPGTEE